MDDNKYQAALHEMQVWQRECLGRESDVEMLYQKLKKPCFALISSDANSEDVIKEVDAFVWEVAKWPPHASEFFGY